MNYVNVWIAIPEDDHNELNNRRGTEDNVGPARQFVNGQLDPEVVQSLYATHQQGQTVRHLWSVILDDRDGPFNEQINAFRQEFPGAQVLGVWHPEGNQLGTTLELQEVPNPDYVGAPELIPNPAYQPDVGPAEAPRDDYDNREFLPNPAWVPEFITQPVQVGTPAYEISDQLSNYMPPDKDGAPDPTVRDVNLPAGWSPRIF